MPTANLKAVRGNGIESLSSALVIGILKGVDLFFHCDNPSSQSRSKLFIKSESSGLIEEIEVPYDLLNDMKSSDVEGSKVICGIHSSWYTHSTNGIYGVCLWVIHFLDGPYAGTTLRRIDT